MVRLIYSLLAAVLLLSACDSSGGQDPQTSPPSAPSSSDTYSISPPEGWEDAMGFVGSRNPTLQNAYLSETGESLNVVVTPVKWEDIEDEEALAYAKDSMVQVGFKDVKVKPNVLWKDMGAISVTSNTVQPDGTKVFSTQLISYFEGNAYIISAGAPTAEKSSATLDLFLKNWTWNR